MASVELECPGGAGCKGEKYAACVAKLYPRGEDFFPVINCIQVPRRSSLQTEVPLPLGDEPLWSFVSVGISVSLSFLVPSYVLCVAPFQAVGVERRFRPEI